MTRRTRGSDAGPDLLVLGGVHPSLFWHQPYGLTRGDDEGDERGDRGRPRDGRQASGEVGGCSTSTATRIWTRQRTGGESWTAAVLPTCWATATRNWRPC